MHRERQHLARGTLGVGQLAFASAERGEAGLKVQRPRIVDLGLDLPLAELLPRIC